MKKNSLLTALAVILVAGFSACTDSEEVARVEPKSLDFSVFANKTTRAVENTGTLNTSGKAFGVWGYSAYSGATTTVFDDQEVKHDGSAWRYSPLKFWDNLSTYKFYAYFPYGNSGVTISNGLISVADFTVEDAPANQVDLMIANEVSRVAGATSAIEFNFNHILSNINLTFKKGTNIGTTKLTITSVKLYGMDNKGSFSQTATSASAGTWTLSGTNVVTAASAQELANSNVVPETGLTPNTVAYSNMLLIPQGTGSVKLDVAYTLGETGVEQPFSRTLELKFDATTGPNNPISWLQNQKITYNFTIDANAILFDDPVVEEWTPDTTSEVPTIE